MLAELMELSNPYAVPAILVGIVVVFLGIVVVGREHGSLNGWLFLAMSVTIGVYLIAAGISYEAADAEQALVWSRIAHVGAGLIPSALIWSSVSIIGRVRRQLTGLIACALFSLSFAGLALFSDRFVSGNVVRFWGYHPTYGSSGLLFLIFLGSIMIITLVGFSIELKRTTNPIHRRRYTGIIVAFAVGSIGAVDFLQAFGIEAYPFGYAPIFVFVIVMGFVVVRYDLVDITPAVAAPQILQTMQSGVLVTDVGAVVRVANDAAGSLLRSSTEDLTGERLDTILDLPEKWLETSDPMESIVDFEMELPGNESSKVLNVSVSPLTDRRKTLLGRVFVAHDITDRKAAEAELRKQALYDSLTGLPNRVLFFDRLNQLLELAKRNDYPLAILYMDLDKFKEINDTMGHEAGDALLQQVANRMRAVTRASDTVARMGGDEFVGVCGRIASPSDAEIVAQKIVESLSDPFTLNGQEKMISVSIGISVYPQHGTDSEKLLAMADQAMYGVKGGGGGYRVYEADSDPG